MNDYTVLFFDGCERCKQFDNKYKHKSCGFDIVKEENKTLQIYECSKCGFKWTKEFKYEDSINN
jgi:transposase-like protein